MAKMTYAKIAEKLNKEYNKYDKNLQNAVTDAEKNSAMMMLQRVSSRLNQLMVSNQNDADMQDAKNTPADSPNQSIGQRTMRMAKNGGKTFPDLTGDGQITQADILKGRGVFGKGGSVSWMFGGKKYSGTLIPSKETSTHKFARTHNGKIKKIKKMQGGGKTLPKLSVDELNALSYEQRMPYYNLPPTDPRNFSFNTAGYLPSQTEFERMPNDVKAGLFTNNPQMDYRFGAADAPNFKSMTPEDQMKQKIAGLNPAAFMQEGGSLKQIPTGNKGLPQLPESIRNKMGYMQAGGKLYDGLTQEAIQEYMYEAGIITGLGDKFDPTNSDHVKKLQEGMLGAFTGRRADRMLSGNESSYINKGGEFSKNNAGKDGRFGIDTFNALKQFTEGRDMPVANLSTNPATFRSFPTASPLLDMQPLPQRAPVTQNTSETSEGNEEGGGVKDFLKNTALKSLPGLAKGIEYMNTYNTLNNMLPPPDLTLNRPQYLNTNVDISADLNALNEAGVMRERALTDSSTKANNVRTNLAGQDASFNKVRGKLFQDKRNKERQLQNAQTAMNFKTEDENRKRIYDNAMNQRDFINDQSRARRDFTSGVVGDVMDYTTQNTNRQSQMARMNALMPYLNQFGVFDRAYDENFLNKYPFMKELLGLKT